MPARKPQGLKVRHDTRAEIDARVANEESMTPDSGLPMSAPARLNGHPLASEIWRWLMREYGKLEASIVNKLDMHQLIDYCILMEQTTEIDLMRKTTYRMWLELGAAHDKAIQKARDAQAAADAAAERARNTGGDLPDKGIGSLVDVEKWEEKAIALAAKCLDAYEAVLKLDARSEIKRKTMNTWRQSLYLTPRSRAGVAPSKKEVEEAPDPMDLLLGRVTDYVNDDQRKQ